MIAQPVGQPAAEVMGTQRRNSRRGSTAGSRAGLRHREKARQLLVSLVTIVYLLVVLEGILRKWVLPGFSQQLFFIRDPLVIAIYGLATIERLWPRVTPLFLSGAVLAVGGVLIVFLQTIQGETGLHQMLFAAYGWRNYFLYPPLAFLVAAHLRSTDVFRIFRWTFMLLVPCTLLVYLQFWAPLDSPINVGIATDVGEQFRGLAFAGGHTRPMGTFTSVLGQTMFVGSAFAMLLGALALKRQDRPISIALLLTAAVALVIDIVYGGSRAAVLHLALTALASMALPFIESKRRTWRAAFLPLALVAIAAVSIPVIFPSAFDATVYRWSNAATIEDDQYSGGLAGRLLFNFFDFLRLMDDTPIFGYGLGLGGNASSTLGATVRGIIPREVAETEWSRQIVDLGPVFGLVFIIYRIAFTAWLAGVVFRATSRGGNPLPLLLFSFVGPELLYGLVTGHGTVNGYTWIFVGITLASARFTPSIPARSSQSTPIAQRSGWSWKRSARESPMVDQ